MSVKNKILSIVSIFALAIMLTLVGIWAVTDLDFTVGGDITYTAPKPATPDDVPYLSFSYNNTTMTATVTAFEGSSTEVNIPSQILYNGNVYTVNSIGDYSFMGIGDCITKLTLPQTLTQLGQYAFQGCSRINEIVIPNEIKYISESCFADCSSLTKIVFSENLLKIYGRAFYGCTQLTSITIPEKVIDISFSAFWGCTNLHSVYIKASTPPTISTDSFENCTSLSAIYVPRESVNLYLDEELNEIWNKFGEYIQPYDF